MELRQFCLHVWRSLLVALAGLGLHPRQLYFLSRVVYDYVSFLRRIRRHHGDRSAFKVFKETERRIGGLLIDPSKPPRKPRYSPFGVWVKTDVWGVPLPLFRLRRLSLRSSAWSKSLAALIAGSFRSLTPVPWSPYPSSELVPRTRSFCADYKLLDRGLGVLRNSFGLGKARVLLDTLWLRDSWRASATPYADSAVHGAPFDAAVLLQCDGALTAVLSLQRALARRAGLTSDEIDSKESSYVTWLERIAAQSVQLRRYGPSRPRRCLQRFGYVADRGGKMRGVTSVNYHLQNALVPIQRALMSMLRRLSPDATYDEDLALHRIRGWTAEGKSCSSYDLPDATTQFPKEVSAFIVSRLLGREVAKAWFDVVSVPAFFPGIGTRSYCRGLSMGLYSVWPVFALCHHAVVQGAASLVGLAPFSHYAIRGDDVCITDTRLCAPYERFWRGLGQAPSPEKSLKAADVGPGVASFAKRTFVRGRVIQALTFAEWRAAVLVEPLGLVDALPKLASIGGSNLRRFSPTSFVSILKSLRGDRSFAWLFTKMRAKLLPAPVAARWHCSALIASQRARATLEAWPWVGSLPKYWQLTAPDPDLSNENLEKVRDTQRVALLHRLARLCGESLSEAGVPSPPGLVSWFAPPVKTKPRFGPFFRGSRRSADFDYSDLPAIAAFYRAVDELSTVEASFSTRWDVVARLTVIISQARGMSGMARNVAPHTHLVLTLRPDVISAMDLACKLRLGEWEFISKDLPGGGTQQTMRVRPGPLLEGARARAKGRPITPGVADAAEMWLGWAGRTRSPGGRCEGD